MRQGRENMGILKIKRIYEQPCEDDGVRIFVDRLWARGMTKERAHLDYWFKEISPSPELRKWFNHEPEKFKVFSEKYKEELQDKKEGVDRIKDFLKDKNVTLLYATKSPTINHAIVLKNFIDTCN